MACCTNSCVNGFRIAFMVLSTFFLLCALILNVLCVVLPTWNTVEISELGQIHQHGLWMFCIKHIQRTGSTAIGVNGVSGDDQCYLKGQEPGGHDDQEIQHHFADWQRTVLILLIISFAMGVLTLLISFCGFCMKWFTVGWAAGALLAFGAALAAIIIFFLNGYDINNRQIRGSRGQIYYQEVGWAFWCALASTAIYLLTFCFSIGVGIMSFIYERQTETGNKTWPKHHTQV